MPLLLKPLPKMPQKNFLQQKKAKVIIEKANGFDITSVNHLTPIRRCYPHTANATRIITFFQS
jgi:hypothetical protein